MAKRFTDTEIWKDIWHHGLSREMKLLWKYLCDNCSLSGIWKVNKPLAEFQIGCKIQWDGINESFNSDKVRIHQFQPERWFIVDFIDFQYGVLSGNCATHRKVIEELTSFGLFSNGKICVSHLAYPIDTLSIPYRYPINDRVLDKDKDKDKDSIGIAGGMQGGIVQVKLDEKGPEFTECFNQYRDMRKKIRKPMTVRAEELILIDLDKLSSDTSTQIEILQQSIKNSWQGVFELKNKQAKIGSREAREARQYDEPIQGLPRI